MNGTRQSKKIKKPKKPIQPKKNEQLKLFHLDDKEKETEKRHNERPKNIPAKETDATPSVFGWDFQITTAVVKSLDYISELSKVIVEGKTEDIEIYFDGGKDPEYLQAKSVQKANEHRTDSGKLTLGLDTLINTSNRTKGEYSKLVYVCNYDNPLSYNDHELKTFWRTDNNKMLEMNYYELTDDGKKYVDNHIEKAQEELRNPRHPYNDSLEYLDKSKLYIATHVFVNKSTKYNTLDNVLDAFLDNCNIKNNKSRIRRQIIDRLRSDYFTKASIDNENYEKSISKKDLVWEILSSLLHITDEFPDWIPDYIQDILDNYELSDNFFIKQTHVMDNINSILKGYYKFERSANDKNTVIQDFIENNWGEYSYMVPIDIDEENDVDSEDIKKYGTQLIMSIILKQRFTIDHVKKGTGLK